MSNFRKYWKHVSTRLALLLTLSMLILSACGNSSRATEEAIPVPTNTTEPSVTPPPATVTSAPTETATPEPTGTPLPQGIWGTASNLRSSRSEMPAVYLDGRIYVISGLSSGDALPIQRSSEMYDVANDEWLSMAPLPQPRHHGMAAAYNGKIYYFGGSPSASLGGMAEAWAYDPALDVWEAIAPLPIHRSAGFAVVYNDYIYIVGGVGFSHGSHGDEADDHGETLRYDPAQDEWALLAPTLQPREHTTAALIGDKIYVFGGRWDDELDTSEIYDPATNTWSPGPKLPEPRAGNGIAILNGLVYLVGGEIWISGPEQTLTSVDVYDPVTGDWSSIPDMPLPLHGVPAVGIGDTLYVIAGSKVAATANNSSSLFIFKP